jgi:hypothetical protein
LNRFEQLGEQERGQSEHQRKANKITELAISAKWSLVSDMRKL